MLNKIFITTGLIFFISLTLTHKIYGLLFKPMDQANCEEFINLAQAEYLKQLNIAGIEADAQAVNQEFSAMLPQGYATANNYFCDALDLTSGTCIAKVWWHNEISQNSKPCANAEIEFLWVLPEFRGKGWGKQVLTQLEVECSKNKVHCIKLHVFRHNTAAVNLYERVGYKIYSITDYGYFMEKPLNDSNQTLFTFKYAEEKDLPIIFRWFKEPHIEKWWPIPQDKEDFFNSFLKRIRQGTVPYLVYYDDKPIGYIQTYPVDITQAWLPPLPQHTIGTDQFIGELDYVGKGYGTLMLKAFIDFTTSQDNTIAIIIVDPDPTNVAAIRCYEKAKFKKIGEYKAPWGQALLMRFDIE